ncbi:hypothetical protein P2318_06240 [Myxococcaceae bacterium GXIMD 01537]
MLTSSVPAVPKPAPDAWPAYRAAIASLVLFIIACATPAMVCFKTSSGGDETMFGFVLLLLGWLGVVDMNFGWFANPPLALALLFLALRKFTVSAVLSGLALLIALSSLSWYIHPMSADEGGVGRLILKYPHVGFFCWVGSILVVLGASLTLRSRAQAPVG